MDTVPGWRVAPDDAGPAVAACPTCGTLNADGARFCQACGRPLGEPEPDPALTPVITAVVCELVSASETFALPDDADERLSAGTAALVAAGGRTYDLPGISTLAVVFGPERRSDGGTLRAVTAAVAARDAVAARGLALRVGVGATDVIGDGDEAEALWTGRVVDLALRLQRMAGGGEIILAEGAYRLIRDAVHADPLDPRAERDGDDLGPLRLLELVATQAEAESAAVGDVEEAGEVALVEHTTEVATDAGGPEVEAWDRSWVDAFGYASGPGEEIDAEPDHVIGSDLDAAEPEEVAFDAPDASGEPLPVARNTEAADDGLVAHDVDAAAAAAAAAVLPGREDVLASLSAALDAAIADGRPVVLALGGPEGSGRTSVARWFAGETRDRAWTVEIAWRPPDAGGTTWPLAALVRSLAGIDDGGPPEEVEHRLRVALDDDADADDDAAALASYLASAERGAPVEQTRRAIARLIAAIAHRRPLILIVDDVERASAGFRPALEALLSGVRAPVLALLIGADRADLHVEPLSDEDAAELVERLLARPNLPPDAIRSIVAACGGNPLAIEHLVAMLADDGHLRWEYGRWTPTVDLASLPLPADLRSLVARRIGGLSDAERAAAAVAATAVEPFDTSALATPLQTDETTVAETLGRLVDRGILRRADDATFAFAHHTIREAAEPYAERMAARRMHQAIAERLALAAPGPDIDEAIGAHLEQAYRLAGSDPGREVLGRAAAERLGSAARGAAGVGDEEGSLALLRRAAGLLPAGDAARAELLLESAQMLAARDERSPAERLLADAVRAARAAGDALLEHRATVTRALLVARTAGVDDQIEAVRDASEAAIAAAEANGDPVTLATAWRARGWVHRVRGHFAAAAEAFEHAADAAASAGRPAEELDALRQVAAAILDGPAPVEESIERCRGILARVRGTGAERSVASALAVLLARAGPGRAAEARGVLDAIDSVELDGDDGAEALVRAARAEVLAGAPERAEALLRRAAGVSRPFAMGAAEADLALLLTDLERTDDALAAADGAARRADEHDVVAQVTWRAAKARCLAALGRGDEARALVRLALRLADQTDLSELRARTRLDLAQVLLASGRANEARPAARSALRALERKGSTAMAARARSILERSGGRTPDADADASANGRRPSSQVVAEVTADTPTGDAPTADPPTPDPTASGDAAEASDAAPGAQPSPAENRRDAVTDGAEQRGERRERHWFW